MPELFIAFFSLILLGVVLYGTISGIWAVGAIRRLRKGIANIKQLLEGSTRDVENLKTQLPKPEALPTAPAEKLEPPEAPSLVEIPEKPEVSCRKCGARWPAGTTVCKSCWTSIETGESVARPEEKEPAPAAAPPAKEEGQLLRPLLDWLSQKTAPDREWFKNLEEAAGKRWITWVGAVVLFLSAGLFVQYAFEQRWLVPKTRVILGIIAGLVATAAGERFIRRKLRALGQGLVGAGLAILYASLYAAYAFYNLLPQPLTFALMTLVTLGGMMLAAFHDAIPIGFLAVLGGFVTPVLLRTGVDARDALFAYLLLLDLGVLGLAFVKRWRALDILAFAGTGAYFTGWYFMYYTSNALTPSMLWLTAFYVVFLIQPFVYHLRLATPIVGERFLLAISNAAGMFGWAHALLYPEHKYTLGFITVAMSASYLALGAFTRKRIQADKRALLGFITLSVMFLTLAIPILLDFEGVTIAWALEAPALLFLAYKYTYFPVRIACLIPLILAAGRIFTIQWPLHAGSFTPVFNTDFGTAVLVASAGGAYAIIHHLHRAVSKPADKILKISIAIASGFLALIVLHAEVWQWLVLSGWKDFVRWAPALVWVGGAAVFLAAGTLLRSFAARASGLVALFIATVLQTWDYSEGLVSGYLLFLNGRFLVAIAGIAVIFAYALVYLRSKDRTRPDEQRQATNLFGIVIAFLALLVTFETWQWLTFHDYYYTARCLLPPIWAVAAVAYLATGIRLRCLELREAGLAALFVSVVLAAVGYGYEIQNDYLLYLNWRFAAALAVPLMIFAHAHMLRRLRDLCHPREAHESEALYGLGIFLVTLLISVETTRWLGLYACYYASRCILPLIWMAGAGAYLAARIKLRLPRLRTAGIILLFVAAILATRGYFYEMDRYPLYLNGRFLAALAVVLMIFAQAFVLHRLRDLSEPADRTTARALNGTATGLLLLLLSVETPLYFLNTMPNFVRANWAAQTSLCIVWGVYAAGMLAFGFWRNIRSLRLSALGLFNLTALKLVIVDMSKVREVYRIVSFFVLGILMIAASYLYHRVEKWMAVTSTEKKLQQEPEAELANPE